MMKKKIHCEGAESREIVFFAACVAELRQRDPSSFSLVGCFYYLFVQYEFNINLRFGWNLLYSTSHVESALCVNSCCWLR